MCKKPLKCDIIYSSVVLLSRANKSCMSRADSNFLIRKGIWIEREGKIKVIESPIAQSQWQETSWCGPWGRMAPSPASHSPCFLLATPLLTGRGFKHSYTSYHFCLLINLNFQDDYPLNQWLLSASPVPRRGHGQTAHRQWRWRRLGAVKATSRNIWREQ